MSGVARPRGPLPARVYWVRRGLVVAFALALVFGIAQFLGRGSDGSDGPAATTVAGQQTQPPASERSPAGSLDATKKPLTKKQKAARKAQRKAERDKAAALPEPSGPCLDGDVVITASAERVFAGDTIPLEFEVASQLSEACTFEVSPATIVLKITSGSDRIWTSQQCSAGIPTETVVARREVPGTFTVQWNGRRSDEDCSRQADYALPGYYHAEAAALGGEPTDVQFQLAATPRETITPKPKIKKVPAPDETTPEKKPKKKARRD